MVTNEQYELCRPILENKDIDEEDKTDQLENLLRKQTTLTSTALGSAVLDVLWKYRNIAKGADDSPMRHNAIRKASPAPWQMNRVPTPLASPPASSSPAMSSGFPVSRPSFSRQRSAVSPFVSPRPSPRLAMAQPLPHSPNLNAYEFSDASPAPDVYGDYGSDTVDWLVADDAVSIASSTGTGSLSAVAPEWVPQPDMSPHDMLRSILGDKMSDEQIEAALEEHAYDLSAAIATLLGTSHGDTVSTATTMDGASGILIGKSMATLARPSTPGSSKSPVVCKYWLASGSCLRADCRFAHDTGGYVCKYWLQGQCLAGDDCQFSHDPSLLINGLSVSHTPSKSSGAYNVSDNTDHFPSLSGASARLTFNPAASGFYPASSQQHRGMFSTFGPGSRPQSRPSSRHQNRPLTPSSLSMDDPDAFPTLGSLNTKRGSKHHGLRSRPGHGSGEKDGPSSLADIVKMSPSPVPAQLRKVDGRRAKPFNGADSPAARKIPEPQHIPWLETGAKANQQYLKHRADAIKHGSIRNKFLQSAAQAWNRNDARAAKALSLRGQAENEEMRKAHRAAAKALYDERNHHLDGRDSEQTDELYIDLHGLHPEEAIEYLEKILQQHEKQGRRIMYAITGTGHHSKNGKDKVGKGVRNWLNEWGYVYREFSVPGERGGYIGGVLGIDVLSHSQRPSSTRAGEDETVAAVPGKIQVLRREDIAV